MNRRGIPLIVLGFVSIAILFWIFHRFQDPELIVPSVVDTIQRMAYQFYAILLVSFGAISYGLYIFHKEKIKRNDRDLLTIIALTAWSSKSRKVFAITFVCYGVFFSLFSGMLIYMPDADFAEMYNVKSFPHGEIYPCCEDENPGYMPKAIVYLTENTGLLIIPINLVFQVTVSYLVALNAAVALSAFNISKKGRGASTVGAAAGLFIACPTCAGTFLSLFVGTIGGITATIALVELQTILIAISIPVLVITPFIMARKLRDADGSCAVNFT